MNDPNQPMFSTPGAATGPSAYDQVASQFQKPQEQAQQPSGRMKYTVQNADGQQFQIDEVSLARQLQQLGEQVHGTSHDGTMLTMAQGKGKSVEMPVSDVLRQKGFNITGYEPQGASYDHVDPSLRALVELPGLKGDDVTIRHVLQGKLASAGTPNVRVEGTGSDWYGFDPSANRWFALTNKPGLDMSDVAGYGVQAPRMIGAALGAGSGATAGAGAGVGVASIPLAMAGGAAGGAAGGFLGDRLTDSVASLVSDDYRQQANHLGNMGQHAAEDAVGGAFGGALSKVPGLGSVVTKGAASRAAQAVGSGAEAAGGAVSAANYVKNSPLVKELGVMPNIPYVGAADMAGVAAQIPKDAVSGLAKGAGWMGESLESTFPKLSQGMRNWSARMLKNGDSAQHIMGNMAEEAGRKTVNPVNAAEGLYKNAMEGGELNEWLHGAKQRAADSALGAGKDPVHFGNQAMYDEALNLRQLLGESAENDAGDTARRGGEWLGKGADRLHAAGQKVRNGAMAVTNGGLNAIKGAGKAVEYGGKGLGTLGKMTAPLEATVPINAGSAELMERLRRRQRALQLQGLDRKIMPDSQLVQD